MIKINLLPPGLYEKKIIRNIAVMFAVLAVLIAGAGLGYKMKLGGDIKQRTAEVEDIEARQKLVQGLKAKVQEEAAKIGPAQAKLDFIENVFKYNEKWPKLYEELAKYTYKKVIYHKLTPSPTSLQIEAFTPSISDAGRFLLNMYRARDIFTSVSISGLPGYGGAAETMNMEAMSGLVMPGETQSWGGGPLPTGVSPHLYRYGGLGAVSAGVARAAAQELTGLNFTVTCTLREQIVAPSLPGAAAAAGAPQDGGMSMTMPGPGPMPGSPTPMMVGPEPVPVTQQ